MRYFIISIFVLLNSVGLCNAMSRLDSGVEGMHDQREDSDVVYVEEYQRPRRVSYGSIFRQDDTGVSVVVMAIAQALPDDPAILKGPRGKEVRMFVGPYKWVVIPSYKIKKALEIYQILMRAEKNLVDIWTTLNGDMKLPVDLHQFQFNNLGS